MAARSELLDHLTDQLAPLGEARGRPMFGGYGVYLDGLIIGLIAFDTSLAVSRRAGAKPARKRKRA